LKVKIEEITVPTYWKRIVFDCKCGQELFVMWQPLFAMWQPKGHKPCEQTLPIHCKCGKVYQGEVKRKYVYLRVKEA